MVCAWLILSISAVIIVQHHISTKIKSSTIIRKYFHGLIVAVFLPGVLIDPNLLYFSSGCIFGIFIILEVVWKFYKSKKIIFYIYTYTVYKIKCLLNILADFTS